MSEPVMHSTFVVMPRESIHKGPKSWGADSAASSLLLVLLMVHTMLGFCLPFV